MDLPCKIQQIIVTMKIIIHAGFHKTGSTSFQRNLASNQKRRKLPENIMYFMPTENNKQYTNSSIFLKKAFANQSSRASERQKIDNFSLDTFKAQFGNYVNKNPEYIIISGESISTLKSESLNRLKNTLESFSSNVTLIGLVRPPYSALNSQIQQRIKEGIYVNLNNLEKMPMVKQNPTLDRILTIQEIFGSRAKIYPFREAVKYQDGLTNYLLNKMEIEYKLKEIVLNTSRSNLQIRLQNEINKLTGNSVKDSILLKSICDDTEDRSNKFQLLEKEFMPIQHYIEQANEKILELLGVKFTDSSYMFSQELKAKEVIEYNARIIEHILKKEN